MKPDIKKLWVDALLSGKYKQGKHVLRNENNEFCCLGVLCDLYDSTRWDDKPQVYDYIVNDNGKETELIGFPFNTTSAVDVYGPPQVSSKLEVPTIEVCKWAELPSENPYVIVQEGDDPIYENIASLNDEGVTFARLAKYIEESL